MDSDIGFIGIGNMGFHMAGNLRKKMLSSATLHVFDVNDQACKLFVQQFKSYGSIEVASSSRELACKSTTVISMIPMDEQAKAVYLDLNTGVIAASTNYDRLILECSTINITTAQDIARKIMHAGVGTYIDAPVSGGVRGAEAGTLSFLLGYNSNLPLAQRIVDTVAHMGITERINFCGGLGSGLVCKIVNNYIGLTNIAVAAEGLAFGLRYGVDKDVLYECIKASSGNSWALNFANPVPGLISECASSNGFKAGFTSRLCAKDIDLGIKAARQVGIDAKLGEVSMEHFKKADQDPRTSGLDGSAIWLHINDEVRSFSRST